MHWQNNLGLLCPFQPYRHCNNPDPHSFYATATWIIFLPLALPGQYVLRGFYPIFSWFIPIKPANKVVVHRICNFSSVLWAVQAEIVHGFISSGDFLCFKRVGMLSRKERAAQWLWGLNIRFQLHSSRIVWASQRQTAPFSPGLTMKPNLPNLQKSLQIEAQLVQWYYMEKYNLCWKGIFIVFISSF